MITTQRGLEFYIFLNKSANYFDIVPKLEQLTKTKLSLQKNKLCVISMTQTDKRLINSDYYNSDTWFEKFTPGIIELEYLPIETTKQEQQTIALIYQEIGDLIVKSGWYDVSKYV